MQSPPERRRGTLQPHPPASRKASALVSSRPSYRRVSGGLPCWTPSRWTRTSRSTSRPPKRLTRGSLARSRALPTCAPFFGCLAYPLLNIPGTKMSGRATRGIYLGRSPEQSAYIVYDPATGRVSVTPHVRFVETDFPGVGPLRNEPAQAGPEAILVPSTTPVQGGPGMQGGHPDPMPTFPPADPPHLPLADRLPHVAPLPRRPGSTARLTRTTHQTTLKWTPSSTASHPSLSPRSPRTMTSRLTRLCPLLNPGRPTASHAHRSRSPHLPLRAHDGREQLPLISRWPLHTVPLLGSPPFW